MFTSAPHFTFAFHHPLMFPVLNVYPSVHVCASAYVYIEREIFLFFFLHVDVCVHCSASSATLYSHARASLE